MLAFRAATVCRAGRVLLDGIDLEIAAGEVTAILGPNGAGKSTLLKAASGQWPLSRGDVQIYGEGMSRFRTAQLAGLRAIVSQATSLAFPLDVLSVVMLGTSVPGFGGDQDCEAALDALDEVGLAGLATRPYMQLSGGERQRVQLARALCQIDASPVRPKGRRVLLLDEPTANLDPAHQVLVLQIARRRAASGATVVIVLHDLNLAAASADMCVLMAGGRLVACGRPGEVLVDPLLSSAYGCRIETNRAPSDGRVFVLPHFISA
jgi:iron complex transport system ATP-binding protein